MKVVKKGEELMKMQSQENRKTALVLGGGGARGSYQIGVWQGLLELGIDFQVVTGTSVGALNGGLIVQGDYEAAREMWEAIETNHVLDIDFSGNIVDFKGYRKVVSQFLLDAFRNKGISANPLKTNIIDPLLDEERMRHRGIEFGIAMTEFPTMRSASFFLDEIPKGFVNLYLLGSASFFPMMQPTKIGTKSYVDGGYHDNIPIDLAIKKGATDFIVVDVKGPGITRRVKVPTGATVCELSSKWSLGTILLFDGARSELNIGLGYLETLKAYGKLQGSWYSFENDSFKAHQKIFYETTRKLIHSDKESFLTSYLTDKDTQRFLLKKLRLSFKGRVGKRELSFAIHELTGKMLRINPVKIYSFDEFNQAVITKFEKIASQIDSTTLFELDESNRIYSGDEWLAAYSEMLPFISNVKMTVYFLEQLEQHQASLLQSKRKQFLIERKPIAFLMAVYLYQLKKNCYQH